MDSSALLAALILLPALGLVTWTSFSMAQLEEDMRGLSGLEGLHVDFWPLTVDQRRSDMSNPWLSPPAPTAKFTRRQALSPTGAGLIGTRL